MAIGSAYGTAAEYRSWTGLASSASDGDINRELLMTSRWLEEVKGAFFNKDAAVVERLFYARQSDILYLDYEGNCPGIATASGLIVKVDTDGDGSFADETAWTINTDFRLLPLQADKGPIARPWDRIARLNGGSYSFIPGELVSVTAVFGWPAVPQIVKEVTLEWTAVWRGESDRAKGMRSELDGVESLSPYHLGQMKALLGVYNARVAL